MPVRKFGCKAFGTEGAAAGQSLEEIPAQHEYFRANARASGSQGYFHHHAPAPLERRLIMP